MRQFFILILMSSITLKCFSSKNNPLEIGKIYTFYDASYSILFGK